MSKSIRIYSWNVNGIRACHRKGALYGILENHRPDVLCVQEIKAMPSQLDAEILSDHGYHVAWAPAERKGYSGVATFSRVPPDEICIGMDAPEYDVEGRMVITRHGDVTVFNGYFPNSQRELQRMDYKTGYYRTVKARAEARVAAGEDVVICGDWNTAHKEIDLKNWRSNRKNSGFTDAERALVDEYVDDGWIDAYRALYPEQGDAYTWWSNRKGVRERNVGWRIDYHFVSAGMWSRVVDARIHPDVMGSDHCPLELEVSVP